MRIAALTNAIVGKRVAKTIFTADGRALLTQGTVLTPAFINSLKERGFQSVYIENELCPDIEVNDAINEATRVRATSIVMETMVKTLAGQEVNVGNIKNAVQDIINDLQGNSDLVFTLSTIRSIDDYTFAHSVNVCVLSLIIASSMHYTNDDLQKVGVGALLHDLGKISLAEVVKKPGPLTAEEWKAMKTHPRMGYDKLRENFEISLLSAHVALQHHERMDGSGYPRGLKGNEIHEFGRIAAVADVYDALTSNRSYRAEMPAYEAANNLMGMAGAHLDMDLVKRLLARVAVFPTGAIVLLSDRRVGVVASQSCEAPDKPVVRVITDAEYQLKPPQDIDLYKNPGLTISKILSDFPDKVKEQIGRLKKTANV